jgi:two-component system response regulator YesN
MCEGIFAICTAWISICSANCRFALFDWVWKDIWRNKMINPYRRRSVLLKYLVSYLLILTIPLIVLSSFLYNNAANALKNEMENYTLDRMQRIRAVFDEKIKETLKIAIKISDNEMLKPAFIEERGYNLVTVKEQLTSYKDNFYLQHVLLYLNDSEYLYTHDGIIKPETLFMISYRMEPQEAQELINMLKDTYKDLITGFSSNDSDCIICWYPIPYGSFSFYGAAGFIIKEDAFHSIAGDLLGNTDGCVFVFNSEGETMFTLGNKGFISEEVIRNRIDREYVQGTSTMRHENMKLSITNIVSAESGLQYVSVISYDRLMDKIIQINNRFMVIIISVVLLGIAVSFYLARVNYRPIRNLYERISRYSTEPVSVKTKNEIDHIRNSLEDIIKRNMELREHFKSHRPFIREQILFMLLKGEISEEDKIKELMELYGLNFPYEYMVVSVITFKHDYKPDDNVKPLIAHVNLVVDNTLRNKQYYVLEMINGDIALIINTSYENCSRIVLESMLQDIRLSIRKEFHVNTVIGVGKVYNDFNEIKKSFAEALATFDHRFVEGQEKIVFFDDITHSNNTACWYPARQLSKFAMCVKQGNVYIVDDVVNDIINNIKEKSIPVGMTRSICFGMINTVIGVANEFKIEHLEEDINELTCFDSLDAFKNKMNGVVTKICRHINGKKESRNEALKVAIVDYINKNYNDEMISLDRIAEEFNLSEKYLSRFFKQQIGMNYIDYLKSLRINYAKKMLRDTEESIRDIMSSIGYTDLPSFIRLFKKLEGITPGEYRKLAADR